VYTDQPLYEEIGDPVAIRAAAAAAAEAAAAAAVPPLVRRPSSTIYQAGLGESDIESEPSNPNSRPSKRDSKRSSTHSQGSAKRESATPLMLETVSEEVPPSPEHQSRPSGAARKPYSPHYPQDELAHYESIYDACIPVEGDSPEPDRGLTHEFGAAHSAEAEDGIYENIYEDAASDASVHEVESYGGSESSGDESLTLSQDFRNALEMMNRAVSPAADIVLDLSERMFTVDESDV
jgi:hypothetical protein